MKFVAIALLLAGLVNGLEVSLKDRITNALESFSEIQVDQQVEGVANCENKCNNVFNRLAYTISTSGDPTFEWRACVMGCNNCTKNLASNAPPSTCISGCKSYPWKDQGILKGVIEPDKACIGGCIIQTCQGICSGGTVDPPNKKNTKSFWPNGGCSIKTQPYSQNQDYVPWNSPNSGQGGDSSVAQCCSNALSLCLYPNPDINNPNYFQLLQNTGRICKTWVPSGDATEICTFYNNAQNCGKLVPVTPSPTA